MSLKEEIEKRHAAEGYVPCHEANSNARMLTLEWRSGKRRGLPWARLIDATPEDGELLLSFGEREVIFHGLNLGDLLNVVAERRLEKVWERPSGSTSPADLKPSAEKSVPDKRQRTSVNFSSRVVTNRCH